MAHTINQLSTRVLERLRVIGAGETPDAADAATVADYYTGSFAELQVTNLTYWEVDAIPEEAFQALVDLIAGRIGPDFGVSRPDLEASGTQRLRVLSAEGPVGIRVSAEHF